MIEKRKFPRVRLSALSILCHQDTSYRGQLENISISGALVRLEQCIIVPHGGEYNLTIYIEGEDAPLQLVVEVVCATHSLAGIKFFSCEAETASRLGRLVERLTSDTDTILTDRDTIRIHLSNYLR